nr:hypothetical protein [bacterium]
NDISWPQCGKQFPTTHAFGIVGVNGYNAADINWCLKEQLIWATKAIGGTSQPVKQLYVATANPGEVINQISTWPTSNVDNNGQTPVNPYGSCSGANDLACSWMYGRNRSIFTEDGFKKAAIAAGVSSASSEYLWWLDVETMFTWQSGSSEALARNTAAIEGFAKYYQEQGAEVGLYSTAYQWNEITGNKISSSSNLNGLKNWRPGGASLKTAKQACTASPLTPAGKVVMTQYVSKNLDYDYSCIN